MILVIPTATETKYLKCVLNMTMRLMVTILATCLRSLSAVVIRIENTMMSDSARLVSTPLDSTKYLKLVLVG